jgi:hypothetical protein
VKPRPVACRVVAEPGAVVLDEARREVLASALARCLYEEIRGKSTATVETPEGNDRGEDDGAAR